MERHLNYDVVVVGGGASGLAAAIGAADAGKKTLVVERNPYLGGQATNSLVPAFCGYCTNGEQPSQVVKGVGQEVLDNMRKLGYFDDFTVSPTGNLIVPQDPEVTKVLFEDMLKEHKVDCILLCTCTGAKVEDGVIKAIECTDDEGIIEIEAKSFVDASGDANLAYLAGAHVEFHHEQKGSIMFRMGNVRDDKCLKPDAMEQAIEKAMADGVTGFTAKRGVAVRVPHTNDYLVNMIGLDFESLDARVLTAQEIDGRRQVNLYAKTFIKYIDGMQDAYLVASGPKCGLRESRRIVGEYTITKEDSKTSKKTELGIGRCGWGAELHKTEGAGESSWAIERGAKYFDIPIGSLKPENMKNLWCAGRIISSDLIASASIRVMGTGFASGHAAGVAAALTIGKNAYDVNEIREELKRQGALL